MDKDNDNYASNNEKRSSKGLKGLVGKIRGNSKDKNNQDKRSPRGSHDITSDNSLTTLPEKIDDKHTIEIDQIDISDEFSQGHYSSLCHAEWRNNYTTMIKAKDDHQITIKNIEYQSKVILKMMNHRNVWTMFGVTKNPPGILMESIDGFLDDKVHASKLDPKTIISVAMEIALGMSHLHACGILHCDLACRSIIAEKSEDHYRLKIGGFDLSCFENDLTKIIELKRTENWQCRWTAPEVLLDNKVSRASDVWSFGVLLWEMCQRKLPYDGLSNAQVVEGVCKQGLRLSTSNSPSGLASLMQKCWLEPEQRPSFQDIFVSLQNLSKEYKK